MADDRVKLAGKAVYPYARAADVPASTPEWAARRRLATAMRRVIQDLVLTEAPTEELERAAEALEKFADGLDGHPKRTGLEGFAESANSGNVHAFFDHSPLIGLSNPLAPPLQLEVRDDTVFGTVVFGSAYEGPPQHLHGGYVAAAFDEVLGFAQSLTGAPGMTAMLKVRYRRPTPLHTPLEIEACVDRIDGRKIFASGRMYCRGELTADAEGLFVSVDRGKFRNLVDAEADRQKRDRD